MRVLQKIKMTRIKKFKNKIEVFNYLKKLFSKESDVILIRGSTAYGPVKKFSDFDVEVYSNKLKKPYYEIVFVKSNPTLISVYFYKYKKGKKTKGDKNVRVIYGEHNDTIGPDFSKDTYTHKQKIKRECQYITDFMFTYLRHGNKKELMNIHKRIK